MIEKIAILASLTTEDRQNLSLFCQKKQVAKGEMLFQEGDEATAMYILVSGKFEVFRTKQGEHIPLGTVEAEEVLGEMALFGASGKRMASARAIMDSELLVILDFSIKDMTKKYPELLSKLQDIITLRSEQNKLKN